LAEDKAIKAKRAKHPSKSRSAEFPKPNRKPLEKTMMAKVSGRHGDEAFCGATVKCFLSYHQQGEEERGIVR